MNLMDLYNKYIGDVTKMESNEKALAQLVTLYNAQVDYVRGAMREQLNKIDGKDKPKVSEDVEKFQEFLKKEIETYQQRTKQKFKDKFSEGVRAMRDSLTAGGASQKVVSGFDKLVSEGEATLSVGLEEVGKMAAAVKKLGLSFGSATDKTLVNTIYKEKNGQRLGALGVLLEVKQFIENYSKESKNKIKTYTGLIRNNFAKSVNKIKTLSESDASKYKINFADIEELIKENVKSVNIGSGIAPDRFENIFKTKQQEVQNRINATAKEISSKGGFPQEFCDSLVMVCQLASFNKSFESNN